MQHDGCVAFDLAVDQLASGTSPQFEPYACYSVVADALHVYTENVPAFRCPIDSTLSVVTSALDQTTFVGLVLYGVRNLMSGATRSGRVTVGSVIEQAVRMRPSIVWSIDTWSLRRVRDFEVNLR